MKRKIKVRKFKTIKAELNRVFSQFIRLRDSDQGGTGQCISCGLFLNVWEWNSETGKRRFFKGSEAGHYYSRGASKRLYFSETNVNLQCTQCNYYFEGSKQGYAGGLIKKYGGEILATLAIEANQETYLEGHLMEVLIKHYKEKIKEFK